MLRVLTLSTLFPDATRPTFGPFVERQTIGLAALPGVAVEVVAPLGLPPLGGWHPHYAGLAGLPLTETWHGLTVHRPRFMHLPGRGARFDAGAMVRALVPTLGRIQETFAFDVIDAQFFWPDGPAAVALGQRFGVPVSIKARGADIHHWGRRPATRAAVRHAGQRADGLLAVSAALRTSMIALGMPGERIAVHYTGIDRKAFTVRDRAAAKAALGIAGPLIVSVGALIPRKGQEFVIDALPMLPGVTLALIGKGPDAHALSERAATRGVASRTRMLGAKGQAAIADWLAAADVMVLPSSSEGLANAWVEALAAGTPAVTCDVGGARELFDRPAAGRLVARDPAAIAAAVRELIDAPPAREDVAATVDRFSWDANAAALEAHLRALVG